MSTATQQAPGVAMSISLGQRVRHQDDYKGQRVTGVVTGLSFSEERGIMADIVLDAPIVIPPLNEQDHPIRIHRQHVPAHELAPFDEREELIAGMQGALRDLLSLYDQRVPLRERPEAWEAARAILAKATGEVRR